MSVDDFLEHGVALFEGIDHDIAHSIARRVEKRVFKKGQTVFFRGATVDGLHMVASGRVSVLAKKDKSSVQIAELGPGEVVGEMSIVDHGTACATIRSDEDGTEIFVLPQHAFRVLMHFNPDIEDRTRALIARRRALSPIAPGAPEPAPEFTERRRGDRRRQPR